MQIDVNLAQNPYKVFINEPLKLEFKTKVAIVSNSKVAGLYAQKILAATKAAQVFLITIPDGEQYKNLASVEMILEQLFVSKFDRKSSIIALGGGVISDISGFVASIYERGIDFINIPTTLLAQVDASVGGKTGVNNKFGKNLIGTFYQPKAVFCDTGFLSTLPEREFNAGMAEVIKMAVMFDAEFIDFLEESGASNLEKIVEKCVSLKAAVVAKDEKENGLRAALNYGHTFAHVIENQTNYAKFLHGEAVAIGMNMANDLALNLGLISDAQARRVADLTREFNLPTHYKIASAEQFYDAFLLDKKSAGGAVKFVLPRGLGAHEFITDVPRERVIKVLKAYE